MATMYYLFFGVFFTVVCGFAGNGDGAVGVLRYAICDLRGDDWVDTQDVAYLRNHASTRDHIITIATAELGVHETTGNNDGPRVEEYLRYTGLGKGHAWCAAFVSWSYGQAGLPKPRNPWSPALFPRVKTYWRNAGREQGERMEEQGLGILPADVFGTYGITAKRINHVGLIRKVQGKYLVTIEGNSNNRVESRRRHLSTIYALADWL